jgi:lipopolysaccharide biosynthesis protein
MTRAFIYNLSPKQGEVLGYVRHCLQAMRPHFARILITVNDSLNDEGQAFLQDLAGAPVLQGDWKTRDDAYKAALRHLGADLAGMDELTLMDCDLFGPVYPFEEVARIMAARTDLDFWGLFEDAILEKGETKAYLPSAFLRLGKAVLTSGALQAFATETAKDTKPRQASFGDMLSVQLEARGFKGGAYISLAKSETEHPMYFEMHESMKRARVPFLSFAPFFNSPAWQDENPSNLKQVLSDLERKTDYPVAHFWQAALKIASLRTLHTNLGYQFTFDSEAYDAKPKWSPDLKIAVCAHVYYTESFEEIHERASTIPTDYDFFMTTASEEKKAILEAKCASRGVKATVRVVGQNRGRDMSSLFIDLKDVVLDGNYDLICRLHSKKSPQVNASTGNYFKKLIFESVLASREYTSHLLDFFATHPHIGMAFAPMIHTGYGTMGHAWFANRDIFAQILAELGCKVPAEPYSPIAVYGTVFWFRPDALRPMFQDKYHYEDYNQEPSHVDGGLAHGQERAMTYIAQARGYMSATVWPDSIAGQASTLMEYKMDSLYSHFPQKFSAPHSLLLSFVNGKERRMRTPKALRDFEKKHRPMIKKIGALIGVKSKKKPQRRRSDTTE